MENDAVSLLSSFTRNLDILKSRLGAPDNMDAIIRRFRAGSFEAAIVAVDGMTDTKTINENILKPCMDLPETAGSDVPARERVAFLMAHAVSVLPMKTTDNIDTIVSDALSGQCVLLCEDCSTACVMDTRGFEKRTIGRPESEKVVLGAHESFSESIRTSITLIRRIVQREELTTEFIAVGGTMKTRCALLYLRGTADEEMIARIRRRLMSCQSSFPLTIGDVEQIIESHPLALIPQCVRTERPDRAASFLAEGQIVILTDGSPEVLGAPATIYHQLHTPDDASMRWQYGTFLRIVRLIGILIHLFLPGFYLAVLRFHPELLSAMLLTSVYETSSRVPFPVFLEALLMTLAFDLISEAGLRAPGALGNALGIVSGLILGQSAVSADIVSPLLLIIVAASGLGGFCVPGYALGIGLKIVQLMMMCAGAAGGLYAMGLLTLALLCMLLSMTSLGSPLAAPVAPRRTRNPDILLRFPVFRQKAKAFYSQKNTPSVRAARFLSSLRARACAAGLCIGAQVLIMGTGAGMPVSLNAAWIASLSAIPASALAAALCQKRLAQTLSGFAPSRFMQGLLAAVLLVLGTGALGALLNLAEQTFLSQARMTAIVLISLLFLLLCAVGREEGAARAAYILRCLGPAVIVLVLGAAVSAGEYDGLFPLLGTGADQLILNALLMVSCAAPALLLLVPPKEADQFAQSDLPGSGFFALYAAAGAAGGCALLLLMTAASSYETLQGYSTWGQRLRLIPASGGRGGLLFSFLTLCQIVLVFLYAANMLLSCEQAVAGAFPKLKTARLALFLPLLLSALALFAMTAFGFDAALIAAAASGAAAWVILCMKGKKA